MAAQLENGYTRIANELLEKLILLHLTGRELSILLFIMRKTYGFQKKSDRIALSQFIDATNFDRKSICRLVNNLENRGILLKIKGGAGHASVYGINSKTDEWVVAQLPRGTLTTKVVAPMSQSSGKDVPKVVATLPHTKEINKQKKEARENIRLKLNSVREELNKKGILKPC
jgi:phage replication O-like protein O